jgi:membrane-associated protease RseP (regulator of RpoE activity)
MRTRQVILTTGVALVLLLMLVASYNDILRIFR